MKPVILSPVEKLPKKQKFKKGVRIANVHFHALRTPLYLSLAYAKSPIGIIIRLPRCLLRGMDHRDGGWRVWTPESNTLELRGEHLPVKVEFTEKPAVLMTDAA